MKLKFKFILIAGIVNLLTYILARLVILKVSVDYFLDLSSAQKFLAFLDGLRFDINTTITFFIIPSLLYLLPLFGKLWNRIFIVFFSLMYIPLNLLLISDVIFFQEATRHIGVELFLANKDIHYLLEMFWEYIFYLPLLFLPGLLLLLFNKIFNKEFFGEQGSYRDEFLFHIRKNPFRALGSYFVKIFLVLLISTLGIFGKIEKKMDRTISISDAFSIPRPSYGQLVLNGHFTMIQAFYRERKRPSLFFQSTNAQERREAILKLREFYKSQSSHEKWGEDLKRWVPQNKSLLKVHRPLNIVIIMLESWSSQYIKALNPHVKKSVTPFFDELSKKGLLFTHFYPNSYMSLYGLSSILMSSPLFDTNPVLGKGLGQYNSIYRFPEVLNRVGYQTVFAQSSIRVSFRMNKIAKVLGFKHYYGKEDYPRIYEKETSSNGWDGEMFSFMLDKMSEMSQSSEKPFFTYLFTGSTHIPYAVPSKDFEVYKHDRKTEEGFLNTLYYADQSLQKFFKRAEERDWFKDTIFILTADHTLKRRVWGKSSHIPLLIYSPHYINPSRNNVLGSQVDIIPTLAHLLGGGESFYYSSMGQSLLGNAKERIVISHKPPFEGGITSQGYCKLQGGKVIDTDLKEGKPLQDFISLFNNFKLASWSLIFK